MTMIEELNDLNSPLRPLSLEQLLAMNEELGAEVMRLSVELHELIEQRKQAPQDVSWGEYKK